MNILHKPEEAFVPVNQPAHFPTFYLFPETGYVRRSGRACNSPNYHSSPSPTPIQRPATKPQGFIARQKQRLRQYCIDTWSSLKRFGREQVHKLFWRAIVPISIACALWIPVVRPAELPL